MKMGKNEMAIINSFGKRERGSKILASGH